MRLLTTVKNSLVMFFGGLPPKEKRPSGLFEAMGYSWGDILFSSAKFSFKFDDMDERLARVRGMGTRFGLSDGSRIIIPHEDGDITIKYIFMQADGKQYTAICSQGGRERNFSIEELRKYYEKYRNDSSRRVRRRAFPGIPRSQY